MFKLKRVDLVGFKSFADRTRLEFGEGTAAIVGPNGCGKSNVGDAINWVLGEQSPRSLRGDRMADLIFNGTSLRPATSLAEVSLTLIDPEALEVTPAAGSNGSDAARANEESRGHPAEAGLASAGSPGGNGHAEGTSGPSRFACRAGEVLVTRRIFRSGESEYLMNGEPCRLRDIQDLFLGTGLGPDSYAIIEQGRIGQILSSKPSDRRAIIEEAAGVSKFKTRKRLAEAKLESSRQNLARVSDILEEIFKQVNSLKRQASKARRHRELTEELGARLKLALTSRFILVEEQCARTRQELVRLQDACSAAARELDALDAREKAAAGQYEQLEGEIAGLREANAEADLERERLAARLQQTEVQTAALDRRRAEAEAEHAGLEKDLGELDRKAAECSDRVDEVRRQAEQAVEAVSRLLARQTELSSSLGGAESWLEECRQHLLAAVGRAAELRNQLAQAGESASSLSRQAARTDSERLRAADEYQRRAAELENCRREGVACEEVLAAVVGQGRDAAGRLEQAREEQAAERVRVDVLRQELSRAQARREVLGESLARHAYSTESVRRLLSGSIPGNGSFRPLGVLADFLEVTPGYEEVVEEFLQRELDCVVVERHEDARHGLDLLQTEGTGRSTFFVTRLASNGHASNSAEEEQPAGVTARVADLVRFGAHLGLNGELALPSLAHAYVVEDAVTGERLASRYPTHHFLTPRGEHYHHRLVSGGKGSSAGPLALRREFRALDHRVTELEPELEAAQAGLEQVASRVSSLEEEVSRLGMARVEAEKDALRFTERLRQCEEALERGRERLELLEVERREAQDENEILRQRRAQIEGELASATGEQAGREAEIAEAGETVRQLRAEADRLALELVEAEVRRGALEERVQAAEAERAELRLRREEAKSRLERLEQQSGAWLAEQAGLRGEAARVVALARELETAQIEARARLTRLVEESRRVRAGREELGPAVEAARTRLEAEREKRSAGEVALARAESDLEHHTAFCREELGREPAELAAELPRDRVLGAEALEGAEAEVRELKRRLAALGPINMMALEELQEAEERLRFLETQRQDLLASIEDTTQAIREIDEVSRRQFLEAFEAINRHFAETFRTLLGGGVGTMRLSDASDPESGIDLVAQPPGKRLQNVLLLSGGEKALVALALLMAIFRFTPSPFCVLDEVDAPLDDSNIERFTRMIQAMSQQTQFILMTHNKRTMEICPVLYGVTMEEPGVSKIVSVRFETPADC